MQLPSTAKAKKHNSQLSSKKTPPVLLLSKPQTLPTFEDELQNPQLSTRSATFSDTH